MSAHFLLIWIIKMEQIMRNFYGFYGMGLYIYININIILRDQFETDIDNELQYGI